MGKHTWNSASAAETNSAATIMRMAQKAMQSRSSSLSQSLSTNREYTASPVLLDASQLNLLRAYIGGAAFVSALSDGDHTLQDLSGTHGVICWPTMVTNIMLMHLRSI